MSQEIRPFVPPSCGLLALGEPTHQEPAFALIRNELFVQLVEHGFRSIVLESDPVAALTVNDFVTAGIGSLDVAMSEGFSHGFGELDANRELVAWLREHNKHQPPDEQVTFHGFDLSTEMMSAPSPRRYLEHAIAYLGLDLDLSDLLGADERWSRTEAVMDASESIGATAAAETLQTIADDMLTRLYGQAPNLIATSSRTEWLRARTYLTAGLDLLRYHRQCAQPLEPSARLAGLSAVRDALMAEHLLDIRRVEARRGPTLVFAHNGHLQRNPTNWQLGEMNIDWFGAGAILGSLLLEPYTVIAGTLGRSEVLELPEPEPDTYEGLLQRRTTSWDLLAANTIEPGRTRTDNTPRQGYFPIDKRLLDGADAILHVSAGTPA